MQGAAHMESPHVHVNHTQKTVMTFPCGWAANGKEGWFGWLHRVRIDCTVQYYRSLKANGMLEFTGRR